MHGLVGTARWACLLFPHRHAARSSQSAMSMIVTKSTWSALRDGHVYDCHTGCLVQPDWNVYDCPVLGGQGVVVTACRSCQLHPLGMVGLSTHFLPSFLYRNQYICRGTGLVAKRSISSQHNPALVPLLTCIHL